MSERESGSTKDETFARYAIPWMDDVYRFALSLTRDPSDAHEVDVTDGDSESANAMREHKAMIDDGTERLLTSVDLSPALDRALASLDEPFRSAVQLVDVEDQSYEAAAEILGVPIGTVRSRLFRARRQMQQQLRAYAIDAGFRPAAAGGRDA
jgi:RNA polymerase sigma factor (sigma-70 family)